MTETRRLYALTDDELADIISALDFNLAMAGGPEAHTLLSRSKAALRRVGPTVEDAWAAVESVENWCCQSRRDGDRAHNCDCAWVNTLDEQAATLAALLALGDARE